MKRILVFFLALSMAAGFSMADEEGTGLSAGVEFGIEDINDGVEPYLYFDISFERSFLDDAVDIFAELGYTLGFSSVTTSGGRDVLPQTMYFGIGAGFNLDVGEASVLSFIVEHEFEDILINPRFSGINNFAAVVTPSIRFGHEVDFGEVFAQVGFPVTYIDHDRDADVEAGVVITLGWESDFDLEVEIETHIPFDLGDEGVAVTPEVGYSFGDFSFHFSIEFAGLGVSGAFSVTPAIGIRFNF
ncbi:MAG: hypothetical protein FWG66_04450 [Spirochaetes bacterium]|nr:hypothetical protein [Spirochaetota bacterium]